MGYIITTIGSITKFIGGSVITAEAAVFNATNYMSPIYYTLKLIENIIPSIHYIPRRTHQQPTANVPARKSSTGKHLCNYFARKRRESKQSIIHPDDSYYDSRHVPRPGPSSISSSIPSSIPGPDPGPGPSSVPSSAPTSYFNIFRALCRATDHIGSYVLANQVDGADTVSISIIPPHAKPYVMPKHKEVRSVGSNVSPSTSIALDSASSIQLAPVSKYITIRITLHIYFTYLYINLNLHKTSINDTPCFFLPTKNRSRFYFVS
jgi:hypothetical protein